MDLSLQALGLSPAGRGLSDQLLSRSRELRTDLDQLAAQRGDLPFSHRRSAVSVVELLLGSSEHPFGRLNRLI